MFNFFSKDEKTIDLNGNWEGYYEYDPHFIDEFEQGKTLFESHIEMKGNLITGYIKEDLDSGGISEYVPFTGKFKKRKIRFTKTYDATYFTDENNVSRRLELDTHTVVNYFGNLETEKLQFSGTWNIMPRRDVRSGLSFNYISGSWKMWRVD